MKQRILSTLLAVCMLASLLPVSAYAQDVTPATPETAQAEQSSTPTPGTEPAPPPAAPDAAAAVQAQINTLPTAEEIAAMDEDGKQGVFDALTAIDEAMLLFTEEQVATLDRTRYDVAYNALTADAAPETLYTTDTVTLEKPESGDGTEQNPYQIVTKENLYWFAAKVNGTTEEEQNLAACAKLMNDITVNTSVLKEDGTLNDTDSFCQWTPIGDGARRYEGTFYGNSKTISGLYFNDTDAEYVGLFGFIAGTVQNVTVADSYFAGKDYVGGICGSNSGRNLTGCNNSGSVSGNHYVGGICGSNSERNLTGCNNSGSVSGNQYVGGICGGNIANISTSTIQSCTNSGTVNGNQYVGGVCGYNFANGGGTTIQNCSNSGAVSTNESNESKYVGGVCGRSHSEGPNKTTAIQNCSNSGAVSANKSNYVGGVCGENYTNTGFATIKNGYNTGAVSGSQNVGGVCGYNHGFGQAYGLYATAVVQGCYNIGAVSSSGSDSFVGGVCGSNKAEAGGTVTLAVCYYNNQKYTGSAVGDNATANTDAGKPAVDFTSGAVTWLLNGSTAIPAEGKTLVWYQNLDNGKQVDAAPVLNTERGTVYQNTENAYSNTVNKNHNHNDANNDGYCNTCGAISDGIAAVAGYSLNIQGTIGIKFHMDLGASALAEGANPAMHFTVNGKETVVPLKDAVQDTNTVSGKTLYVFTCRVGAEQMTNEVAGYIQVGNTKGKTFTQTVRGYSDKINKDDEQPDKTKELITAMLQYGAYAQLYTDHKVEEPAIDVTSQGNVSKVTGETLKTYHRDPPEPNSEIGTFCGSSLTISDETTLRYYFKLAEGVTLNDVTFEWNKQTLQATQAEEYACVAIENINAKDLDTNYTVTASVGKQNLKVEYSTLAYAYQVLNSEQSETITEDLQNLMRALYLYNQAANNYQPG